MLGPIRVNATVSVPEAAQQWRFSRSSGPGGQGVNTTDSRAELRVDVAAADWLDPVLRERVLHRLAGRLVDGVLVVVAGEQRSQLRNRDAARARLAAVLADALRPPSRSRRATRPTRGSNERRLAAKRRRGDTKRLRRGDD